MISGSFSPIGVGAADAVTTALAIGAALSRREGAVPPAAADERGPFVVTAAGAEASKERGAVLPDRWGAVGAAKTVLKAGVKAISEEGAVAPAAAGLGEETVLRGAVAQGGLTLAAAVTAERAVTVATEMGAEASKGVQTPESQLVPAKTKDAAVQTKREDFGAVCAELRQLREFIEGQEGTRGVMAAVQQLGKTLEGPGGVRTRAANPQQLGEKSSGRLKGTDSEVKVRDAPFVPPM